MAFKIIAFDSDGVGAIGSALALQMLDPKGELVRQADMFAGNAMSAVTALELANGVSLERILKFFRAKPGSIFKPEGLNFKYTSEPMAEAVIKLFGMARLSELPLSGPKVMVNVEQLTDPDAQEWKTMAIGSGRQDPFSEMLLGDLALAACSADGFF